MISEALLFFACASNHGCSETTGAYQHEHPEIAHQIEQDGKEIENFVGKDIVGILGPPIYFLGGGTSKIKLDDIFYLQINKNSGILIFKKEFK